MHPADGACHFFLVGCFFVFFPLLPLLGNILPRTLAAPHAFVLLSFSLPQMQPEITSVTLALISGLAAASWLSVHECVCARAPASLLACLCVCVSMLCNVVWRFQTSRRLSVLWANESFRRWFSFKSRRFSFFLWVQRRRLCFSYRESDKTISAALVFEH